MNRERHSWNKVLDFGNCCAAVLDEANTDRCRRSRKSEVMRGNVEALAHVVRERLGDGFDPHPFIEFDLLEYGKLRHIRAPDVDDAMCHRAVTRILEPLVYRRMVPRSYCPVPGRGGLKLARDLRRLIRNTDETCRVHNKTHRQAWRTWILKSDIHKYFPSIRKDVAVEAMLRIFDEREITEYLDNCLSVGEGLSIGAGYSSMVANAILIPLDWRVIGMDNVRGYVRYMDDTAVVLRSKSAAQMVHEVQEEELNSLGLTTSYKWTKFPAEHHAVEMGGWRIMHKGIYPSTRVEKHLRRLLRGNPSNLSFAGKAALASLYGYIKNGDSQSLKELWRRKHADRIFQEIGESQREAQERGAVRLLAQQQPAAGDLAGR